MVNIKIFENKTPQFYLLPGIIVGLIGAFITIPLRNLIHIRFWGHWAMDTFSIFILLGGLAWVLLFSYFSASFEDNRIIIISCCAALIPGILMAIITTSAAWDHNPMGEFHQEGYINWGGLAFIGGSSLFLIALPVFLIFLTFSILIIFVKERCKHQAS